MGSIIVGRAGEEKHLAGAKMLAPPARRMTEVPVSKWFGAILAERDRSHRFGPPGESIMGAWDALLAKYVDAEGNVEYTAFGYYIWKDLQLVVDGAGISVDVRFPNHV